MRNARRAAWAALLRAAALLALVAARVATQEAPSDARAVVLVVLAGGARSADTVEGPRARPELLALAKEGTLFAACRVHGDDAGAATRAIVTGRAPDGSAPRPAGPATGIVGAVRAEGNAFGAWLVAEDHAWPATLGLAGDASPLAQGLVAPSLLAPAEPGAAPASDAAALRALRRAVQPPPDARPPLPDAAVIEAFEEIGALGADAAGGGSDARVLDAARMLALTGRARLVVTLLNGTRVAAASARRYEEALAACARGLARLHANLAAAAPERAPLLLVVPAIGWNQEEKRGVLGQDERGPSVRRTWLLAIGPGVRPGEVVRASIDAVDVAPTIAQHLGVRLEGATGRPIRALAGTR